MKTPLFLTRVLLSVFFLALLLMISTCSKSDEKTVVAPSLTTKTPSSITPTSADVGGYVSSDGGANVTERGVCYSTSQTPTVSDFVVVEGGGTGNYQCTLSGLDPSTKYYARAYALNSAGAGYGNQVSFTTLTSGGLPTVITYSITNITQNSAQGGGNVTGDGGSQVTPRGVCWSTSENPTITDSHTTDGSGTGSFTSNITGLTASTLYYIRAYATNNAGTAYGNQQQFTTTGGIQGQPCPGIPTIQYEGKTYNTIIIGDQCWFKENLNVGNRIIGSQSQSDNEIKEKYCYNNLESNCNIYGGLYQWNEMMQYNNVLGSQGLCPNGWHIPTDEEWTTLTNHLGGNNIAGSKMKELGFTHWQNPNTGATNESGFTALPGGYKSTDDVFEYLGSSANIWSSTEYYSSLNAWYRSLYNYNAIVGRNGNVKSTRAFSVRCLQNNTIYNFPTVQTANIQNITQNSAQGGGNVTDDGGSQVTQRGVCWSTSQNPTISDNYTTDGSGTGSFTSSITGLLASTTYYVRAYAANNSGTSYGSQVSFTTQGNTTGQPCPGLPTITYQGKTYNTVQIETQCWLKENLNVGTRINGSQNQNPTNGIIEKYCYNDLESNCDIYGGLYQWDEIMQGSTTPGIQGICPLGWHIPTDNKWKVLEGTIDSQYGVGNVIWDNFGTRGFDAGKNIKSSSMWYSNGNGTNAFGFTALPAGYRNDAGIFYHVNQRSHIWSSTEYTSVYSLSRSLNYLDDYIGRYNTHQKGSGYSVRCLKNN